MNTTKAKTWIVIYEPFIPIRTDYRRTSSNPDRRRSHLSLGVTAVESHDPLDLTETPFSLCEGLEATAIEAEADRFFNSLHQKFPAVSVSPRSNIFDKFASLLPAEHLNRLVESAENLVDSQLDKLDRLVVCLSDLFPQWSPEDLQVFARPYAYTMRNGQSETNIETENWQSLSENCRDLFLF